MSRAPGRRGSPARALRLLTGGALFSAGALVLWTAASHGAAAQAPSSPAPSSLAPSSLTPSSLTLKGAAAPFWVASSAPTQWDTADAAVAAALRWRRVAAGAELAELSLRGTGEAAMLRAVVLRVDPRVVRLSLRYSRTERGARWSIDSAPASAIAALNAGQFDGGSPWGWVVRDGHEALPPQHGPLSVAVLQRRDGAVEWVADGDVAARRARRDDIAWAFQSYPLLLDRDGVVPAMLRGGSALDLAHRDRRLALGSDRDGRLLVMLTEVDLPGVRDAPLGLTIPETAALMGALGAARAVALDGGISAQLRVGTRRWRGWRLVPLALVVEPR